MYYLTDEDLRVVRELVQLRKAGRFNPSQRPTGDKIEDQEMHAPETYIAKTPASGIPALIFGIPGLGTGTGSPGQEDRPGSTVCPIFKISMEDQTGTGVGAGGFAELVWMGFQKLVYNFSSTAIPGSSWIIVTRDKGGYWWAVSSQAAASNRFLARLTQKTYTGGQYTKYTWAPATDTSIPTYPDFSFGVASSLPAYHIDNMDLPVPIIVYLTLGNGAYYWIDMVPDWEFVRKTGPASGGYFPGKLIRWDQATKGWIDVASIKIIDANAS